MSIINFIVELNFTEPFDQTVQMSRSTPLTYAKPVLVIMLLKLCWNSKITSFYLV